MVDEIKMIKGSEIRKADFPIASVAGEGSIAVASVHQVLRG
jgi:hypothetical protein